MGIMKRELRNWDLGGEGEQTDFFHRRVKLTLEGIYGRGGYNGSGEPGSALNVDKARLGPCRTVKG